MTPLEPAGDSSPRWLITFADLAAVLLAFFVMMFAMAEVDSDRWEGAVDALSRRAYVQDDEAVASRPQAERNIPVTQVQPGQSLPYLSALLERQVARVEGFDSATVRLDDDQVVISLPTAALFDDRGSRLTAEGRRLAFEMSGVLAGLRNAVAVVAYSRSAGTESLGSSLARANALESALRSAGFRRPAKTLVQVTGLERRAKVRTIDLILLDAGVVD